MKTKILLLFIFIILVTETYSFNFLINLIFGILPQPVRSAFKGEGLQIDQFEYGFGNCNFSCLGYFNSNIEYKEGIVINEKFDFAVPTYYLFGGYISHVSTPILNIIYPGWQLETEVGYGGVGYNPSLRQNYREFFVTGTSGFNWRVYKSKKFTANILTGYKLHYVLKDLLYYGIQCGVLVKPRISVSCEYYTTYKGGNFFIFSQEMFKTESSETSFALGINFLLSKKYLLKFNYIYKQWETRQYKLPEVNKKICLSGITISFVNR